MRILSRAGKIDPAGQWKEPILIGVASWNVALVRRRRGRCCSRLDYDVIPPNAVRVAISCVHRKELTLVPAGDKPVRAVLTRGDRDAWRKWDELLASPLPPKKGRVTRRGSFKIKGSTDDPFQDHTFDAPDDFLIDESYFHFWVGSARGAPAEAQVVAGREHYDRELQDRIWKEMVVDREDKRTGCC